MSINIKLLIGGERERERGRKFVYKLCGIENGLLNIVFRKSSKIDIVYYKLCVTNCVLQTVYYKLISLLYLFNSCVEC
jgi:hypothetical protein